MSEPLDILRHFIVTRWRQRKLKTRRDVERRQQTLLAAHTTYCTAHIPFYRAFAGVPFRDWPMLDKASANAHFTDLNAIGLTRDDAWAMARQGLSQANSSSQWQDFTIGTSTGTSGNRGLFVVSRAERRRWLGTILAKTLDAFPFRSYRVALLLATGNELYETANASRRIAFRFYDIRQGVDAHLQSLSDFAPDVLIGPPKALRAVGERGRGIRPSLIFSGGEVLDPLDATAIAAGFGIAPRQIYQATEGFLGVSCAHGSVHLNEDMMLFEWLDGGAGRVKPVITDLTRRTQVIVRYAMNDLLQLSALPCPCGSPLQRVERIEGRADDTFALDKTTAGVTEILPDQIRLAILDTDPGLNDFRVRQLDRRVVELQLPTGTTDATSRAVTQALQRLFAAAGAAPIDIVLHLGIETRFDHKLRRVENAMPHGQGGASS